MAINNLSTFPGINPIGMSRGKDINTLTKLLKHKHMIEFIERFEWKNLPPELPSDLIERILFFRFKGGLFKYDEKFWFLPFTLKGTIDSYGRYETVTPVLFTGQFAKANQKNEDSAFLPEDVLGKKCLACYGKNIEVKDDEIPFIVLNDTSLEISQDFEAQNTLINPLIEQLVDILVLVNIDLVTSAKVFYVVAKDENQKPAIEKEFENLDAKILNGKRVVVVTSDLDLQELAGSQAKDQARYFQTYQSFDNLRKDVIGLTNGGTFMKQEHQTDMETEVNTSSGSAVMENALRQRKEFCDLVNHYYGLNISVEIKGGSSGDLVAEQGEQTKQINGDDNDAV